MSRSSPSAQMRSMPVMTPSAIADRKRTGIEIGHCRDRGARALAAAARGFGDLFDEVGGPDQVPGEAHAPVDPRDAPALGAVLTRRSSSALADRALAGAREETIQESTTLPTPCRLQPPSVAAERPKSEPPIDDPTAEPTEARARVAISGPPHERERRPPRAAPGRGEGHFNHTESLVCMDQWSRCRSGSRSAWRRRPRCNAEEDERHGGGARAGRP